MRSEPYSFNRRTALTTGSVVAGGCGAREEHGLPWGRAIPGGLRAGGHRGDRPDTMHDDQDSSVTRWAHNRVQCLEFGEKVRLAPRLGRRSFANPCRVHVAWSSRMRVARSRFVERREGAPPRISRAHIAYPPIGDGQVDHCVRDAAMAHSGPASPGAISFIRARPDESLRYNFAGPSRA
jgi:hypothetical protein